MTDDEIKKFYLDNFVFDPGKRNVEGNIEVLKTYADRVRKEERERCLIAVQEYRSYWCPMDFESKNDLIKHMERWISDKILATPENEK